MKRLFLFVVVLLIVAGLMLLPACNKTSAPATTATSVTTATSATTVTPAKEEVIRWRMQLYASAWDTRSKQFRTFAENVWEQSNHRLKIEQFLAGALGYTGFEMAPIVGKGLIEMAEITGGSVMSEAPLFTVCELPFLFWTEEQSPLANAAAIPFIDKAADKINTVRIMSSVDAMDHLFANVAVPTLKDWQGLKLRTWSPILTSVLTTLGVNVATVPWSETYTAFSTKVVQGNVSSFRSVIEAKHYEVLPICSLWTFLPVTDHIIVNKDSFNSLPKDIQDILIKNGAELGKNRNDLKMQQLAEDRASLEKYGMKFVDVSLSEKQSVANLVSGPAWSDWRKAAGSLGDEAIAAIQAAAK